MTPRRAIAPSQQNAFAAWKNLARRWRDARQRWLLLDFDGTLAPIVSAPTAARMKDAARCWLCTMAGRPHTAVAVVSGRSIADLRKRVSCPRVWLVGNHGLEIGRGRRIWTHPAARAGAGRIAKAKEILRPLAHRTPGARLEDKRWTLSLHDRNIPGEHRKRFASARKKALGGILRHLELFVRHGKRVTEVLPTVDWNKGTAVRRLLGAHAHGTFALYMGDDVTDESAFTVVNDLGMSVRVGSRRGSAARFSIPRQRDVSRFLKTMASSDT